MLKGATLEGTKSQYDMRTRAFKIETDPQKEYILEIREIGAPYRFFRLSPNTLTGLKLYIYEDMRDVFNPERARIDIEEGCPVLCYFTGGDVIGKVKSGPLYKAYGIPYYAVYAGGESMYCEKEKAKLKKIEPNIIVYNQTIFACMDSKYGKSWRKVLKHNKHCIIPSGYKQYVKSTK